MPDVGPRSLPPAKGPPRLTQILDEVVAYVELQMDLLDATDQAFARTAVGGLVDIRVRVAQFRRASREEHVIMSSSVTGGPQSR